MENITLRRQANPLSFYQLFEAQRSVCIHVAKLVNEYDKHNQQNQSTETIQKDRVSNLIFIDGNRGIGKSTLILSLIDGSSKAFRKKFMKRPESETPTYAKQLEQMQVVWKPDLLNRLVWLDILDLELLPKNTNLLATILVRIEEAFKQVSAFSDSEKKSVLFPSTAQHPWTEFKKLMSDVSLGWDSSLIQRRNGDPDTYSQELMRTERARLSFENFHKVMEKIGLLYQEMNRMDRKPLFILPVDDADLNPQRYLELFRLTRILSCSNLVFLIAGHVENLDFLFELSFADELNQIASANFLKERHEKISGLAEKLGYAARRKLIPPYPHLIKIHPISVKEGFAFKPEGLPDADHTEITFTEGLSDWALLGLLKSIHLPSQPNTTENADDNTLYRDYLKPAQDLSDLINLKIQNEQSSMAELVAGPSRAIYDLCLELIDLYQRRARNQSERDKLKLLIGFLAQSYRNAINESHDFTSEVHDQFIDLFLPTGGYSIQQRIQRHVLIESESLSRLYESQNNSRENYQFRKPGPFKLSFIAENGRRYTLKEDWKNAWAYLLHDVSLLLPGNTIERVDLSKVTNYWAQSHIFARENESVVMWPCPDWITIHYAEKFRLYWNACLEKIPNIERLGSNKLKKVKIIPTPLNYLAYCWIWGITCLVYEPEKLQVPEILDETGYGLQVAESWMELASWISSLALETPSIWSGLRNNHKNEWIFHLIPRLLSPEMGLPWNCVAMFQSYIQVRLGQGTSPEYSQYLSPTWPRFARDIIEARAQSIIKYDSGNLLIPVEVAKRNIELLESYYQILKVQKEPNIFNQNPIETFESGKERPLNLSRVLERAKEIVSSIEKIYSGSAREKSQHQTSSEPGTVW